MIRRHFGLLSVPSSRPYGFFFPASTHLTQSISLSTQPSSITLPPSYSFPSQFSQISAPCFPLTLMPPALSLFLFSSSSSHPSLHFTPVWLCPHHYVLPPAPPLSTHSNSALAASASPSPSIHYSYCWKLHRQTLTVKDSFTRLDSFYPSRLFSHSRLQHNWNYLWCCFRSWKHSISTVVVLFYLDMSMFLLLVDFYPVHTCTNAMDIILHSDITSCFSMQTILLRFWQTQIF